GGRRCCVPRISPFVMPALVAGIHVLHDETIRMWMARATLPGVAPVHIESAASHVTRPAVTSADMTGGWSCQGLLGKLRSLPAAPGASVGITRKRSPPRARV